MTVTDLEIELETELEALRTKIVALVIAREVGVRPGAVMHMLTRGPSGMCDWNDTPEEIFTRLARWFPASAVHKAVREATDAELRMVAED